MDHDDDAVELRLLRERIAALEDRIDRLEGALLRDEGALLVQTATDGSYPSSTGVFFKVTKVTLEGVEAEGSSPSYTVEADSFYAVGYGASVPSVGTKCLAVLVPYRWVVLF